MMGLLIWGPALSCLDVLVVAMVQIAALAALASACVMTSFWLICSLAIFFCLAGFLQFVYEFTYMRLPFCCYLFLLRLSDLSLPYVLQSAFVRLFTPDTM